MSAASSQDVFTAAVAQCAPPCTCPGSTDICSSVFPPECGFGATSILSCSGLGTTPVVKEDCSASGSGTKVCAQTSNGTTCLPTECTCTSDDDACGSSFPASCKLDANALYTCSGAGAAPELKLNCAATGVEVCASHSGDDVCLAPECTCTNTGTSCGSQFPDSCGYDDNSVFQCSAEGAAPEVQQDCGSGLCVSDTPLVSAAFVDGVFMAAAAQCVPPCTCPGSSDICGSTLSPECGFGNTTILSCSGAGSTPVVKSDCTSGTVCATTSNGTICLPTNCTCTSNSDVCGSRFPDSCNLDPNALYSCSAAGAAPEIKEDCGANGGDVCAPQSNGDVCVPSECTCSAAGDVCGSEFLELCRYDKNSLYTCSGPGAVPEVKQDCGAGVCVPSTPGLSANSGFAAAAAAQCAPP
ncbi:hypothetical protein BGZ73_001492, partial [Actinomortierella ambigua]